MVLLLKTISSCLADMALSELMIMFLGLPHVVLFHNSPRNMIIPLDCFIYLVSLAQIPLIVGCHLAML